MLILLSGMIKFSNAKGEVGEGRNIHEIWRDNLGDVVYKGLVTICMGCIGDCGMDKLCIHCLQKKQFSDCKLETAHYKNEKFLKNKQLIASY